jgi:membrane protein DedA with SNARE-associated domain
MTGSSGYPFIKFLCYDAAGELTWLLLFGARSRDAFGSQWKVISNLVSDLSGLLVGLVLLGAGIYFIVRKQQDKVPEKKSLATPFSSLSNFLRRNQELIVESIYF